MRSVWMLTCSNLRKSKSSALIFSLIAMLSALLLNSSMILSSGFNMLFEQVSLETNSADFAQILPLSYYKEHRKSIDRFFLEYDGVTAYEPMEAILLKSANLQKIGGDNLLGSWNIRNAERSQKMSVFRLVEKLEVIPQDAIYVPYVCKTFFGYSLGDNLNFQYQDKIYTYHIAGFTEDTIFGSRYSMAFDLPEDEFKSLSGSVGKDAQSIILLTQTTNPRLSLDFLNRIGDVQFASSVGKEESWFSRVSSMLIYNYIMIAFVLINIIVSIIIIQFLMRNTISQEMRSIGALKAIGYTDRQIISAYVVQFGLLGFIGAVLGTALSYLLMNALTSSVAADVGFVWQNIFMLDITLIGILFTVAVAIMTTWICSRGIRKLPPIKALRGGIESHNFKKIFIPLDSTHLSLNYALAMKTVLNNKRKNILVIVIIATVIMASSFAVTLFSNIVLDKEGLLQITGAETFSAVINAQDQQNTKQISDEIKRLQGVKKVITSIGPGSNQLLCDNSINGNLTVYDNYQALERTNIYEGRYPKHDNEIAISGNLSKILRKAVGDTIEITNIYQKVPITEAYIVTGFTQGTYSGGMDVFLTMIGLQKISSDIKWEAICVYLEDQMDTDTFISQIKYLYGDKVSYVEDFTKLFRNQFRSNVNSVSLMVILIMILTIAIVILVIILVVKSMLLQRRHEFGVMKALGYTTAQIMQQVAISCLLVILVGGTLGSILATIATNYITILMFGAMGVHRIDFAIPVVPIMILVAIICLLAYGVSLLTAYGIRKISPCDLLRVRN